MKFGSIASACSMRCNIDDLVVYEETTKTIDNWNIEKGVELDRDSSERRNSSKLKSSKLKAANV